MKEFAKLGIAVISLATNPTAWAAGSVQVIAIDETQGASNAFSNPVLNEAGKAAFVGFRVAGGFSEPDLSGGVYVGDGRGPLTELVKVGDPGFLPDSFVSSLTVEAINDVGQVAYLQGVSSAAGEALSTGLFLHTAGTAPLLLVKRGDPDPDGASITGIRFTDLDVNGRVGLSLTSGQSIISTSVFESGGLRILAKQGQPAPDGIGTVAAAFFPSLNDAGQINYDPRIARPGFTQRPALFRETPGLGRQLLFRSEDPTTSPGIDGTLILEHYTPSMNETGQVVFAGSVSGAGNPDNNGRGLFASDGPSSVFALVREGHPVAGGDTFACFGRPSLNESGDVAFYALLTTDTATVLDVDHVGLYRRSSAGDIHQIAREGQVAPTGDGTIDLPRFGVTSSNPSYHFRPMFNDKGQVAFRAGLVGTSSGGTNEHAIFFFDDALGLIEIARTGNPLLAGTITDLGLRQSNRSDGDEEIGFNDAGQIAFRFELQDGRNGVAIWSPDSAAAPFNLTITRGAGYDFEWDSQPNMVYDLVTSTDLATPVSEWPVYDPDGQGGVSPYRDIPPTGTTTTLTAVPADGPKRFFAVVERVPGTP